MIFYLNRAEALALFAAYRRGQPFLNATDKFFASRAIVRMKRYYAKSCAKLSVTDNSTTYYERMQKAGEEEARKLSACYNNPTIQALKYRLDEIYKDRTDENEESQV